MLLRYFDKIVTRARQFRPAPDEAIVQMDGGYRLSLRPNADAHERQLYFNATYEAATLALFDAVLRPGDTMVDVGANLGIMSLHAAAAVGPTGTVIALEPHPVTFSRLANHIEMNGRQNIRAIQCAAGASREQRAIFDAPTINIGAASLIAANSGAKPVGTVEVDRLDDILAALKVGAVRLLKIDVEGFEPNVLRGSTRTLMQQPIICMEVSASVDNGDDEPLAAHDIIMATGVYAAYTFKHGKGRACPLVAVNDRHRLARQVNDNVVYVPYSIRPGLPAEVFAS